jgi:hypothetical protein
MSLLAGTTSKLPLRRRDGMRLSCNGQRRIDATLEATATIGPPTDATSLAGILEAGVPWVSNMPHETTRL